MLELGIGADLVRRIGWVFWGLIGIGLWLAISKPKTRVGKAMSAALVLAVPVALIGPSVYRNYQYQKRYAVAKALFDERCKTAGEKIYRIADNVAGVYVIKPRIEPVNHGDQFKLDDPYGYAGSEENYLKLFIRGRPTIPIRIGGQIDPSNVVTYSFVEINDETGKGVYQYTTPMSKEESERLTRNGGSTVPIERVLLPARTARYGITWDDISTQEDRKHWIAGGVMRIIDLQSNSVMAEHVGYMFDAGLGNLSGGRSPWAMARNNACPLLNEMGFYFFDRVIRPTRKSSK